jgi:hypothetical protein
MRLQNIFAFIVRLRNGLVAKLDYHFGGIDE